MTNTYNITATDCTVMVPVLSETRRLMAWLLYPDPTGTLQDSTALWPFPGNTQAIPRQFDGYANNPQSGIPDPYMFLKYKNAFGYTGQPIFHSSKAKTMAKTASTGGLSTDKIKTDPAFERTRENMAELAVPVRQLNSCARIQYCSTLHDNRH